MEDFKKLFYEEAQDLVVTLEEALMQLENDYSNKDLINEVFRVMHSLKGSGAMFGYNNLSSFTHELETLYHYIRSNQLEINGEILNFTIGSVDLISGLLKDDDNPKQIADIAKKKKYIQSLLSNFVNAENSTQNEHETESEEQNKNSENNTYLILFEPDQDILCDGTNPLYLIDELCDLGKCLINVNTDKVPEIGELKHNACFVSWTCILSTDVSENEIKDVFIFVEDTSSLEIDLISKRDLLNVPSARSALEEALRNKDHSVEVFADIAKEFDSELDNAFASSLTGEISAEADISKPENEVHVKQELSSPEFSLPDMIKVNSKKLDTLINLVSEFITIQARLDSISHQLDNHQLEFLSEDFQQLSRQFRDIAFELRLIPIHTLVIKFKRLVRDLSQSLNKKVNLITEGTETELDKSIIDKLSDPIMHIIRNAVDHGIESPDEREKLGKPKHGTIKLSSKYSGNTILISIHDDGKGIDTQRVIKKAIERKLISDTDELDHKQIVNLLMKPGFTTSNTVTDISGRGVGMDVVRKKINELRGEVIIDSEHEKGTTITIKLPLTLSIIDGLLVTVNHNSYVIPLSSIYQVHKISREDIETAKNNVLIIDGVQIPTINLVSAFNNSNNNSETQFNLVTIKYLDQIAGLVVNKLVSQFQAVIKPIGEIMENEVIFAGGTILGDGKIALVIDTNRLIDYYSNNTISNNERH